MVYLFADRSPIQVVTGPGVIEASMLTTMSYCQLVVNFFKDFFFHVIHASMFEGLSVPSQKVRLFPSLE